MIKCIKTEFATITASIHQKQLLKIMSTHTHTHTHTHKVRTNKLNSVLKGLESERDNKLFSFHSQLYVTHLVRTEGSVLHLDTALVLLDGVEHNVIKV